MRRADVRRKEKWDSIHICTCISPHVSYVNVGTGKDSKGRDCLFSSLSLSLFWSGLGLFVCVFGWKGGREGTDAGLDPQNLFTHWYVHIGV